MPLGSAPRAFRHAFYPLFAAVLAAAGMVPPAAAQETPAGDTGKSTDYMDESLYKKAAETQLVTKKVPILGELLEINAYHTDRTLANKALTAAVDEARRVDKLLNAQREDTEVGAVNAAAGDKAVIVGPETWDLLNTSLDLAKRTKGAFDPTWAALRKVWNFEDEVAPSVPKAADIKELKSLINHALVEVKAKQKSVFLKKKGMQIDFGGIATGYAMDRVAKTLRDQGITDFRVKMGHNVMTGGTQQGKPWAILVPDPRKAKEPKIPLVPLVDEAMVTSWDQEKFFEVAGKRYHHIINPKTGFPGELCKSVSIVAPQATMADGLATAVFIMGPAEGIKLIDSMKGHAAIIVDAGEQVHYSKAMTKLLEERQLAKDAPPSK